MNEHDAFVRMITENLDEDAPRLVYADWLDERGEHEYAGLIRAQIGLHAGGENDPRREEWLVRQREWDEGRGPLTRPGRERWLGDICRLAPAPCWTFVRGFPAELDLRQQRLGFDLALALAGCTHLATVTTLNLWGNHIGPVGTAVLAWSPFAAQLREVDLSENDVGDEGAMALAQSPVLGSLTKLKLDDNGIGSRGARALASARGLTALTVLHLSGNPAIGPGEAEALALSRHLSATLWLSLCGTGIADEEADDLERRFGNRLFIR